MVEVAEIGGSSPLETSSSPERGFERARHKDCDIASLRGVAPQTLVASEFGRDDDFEVREGAFLDVDRVLRPTVMKCAHVLTVAHC